MAIIPGIVDQAEAEVLPQDDASLDAMEPSSGGAAAAASAACEESTVSMLDERVQGLSGKLARLIYRCAGGETKLPRLDAAGAQAEKGAIEEYGKRLKRETGVDLGLDELFSKSIDVSMSHSDLTKEGLFLVKTESIRVRAFLCKQLASLGADEWELAKVVTMPDELDAVSLSARLIQEIKGLDFETQDRKLCDCLYTLFLEDRGVSIPSLIECLPADPELCRVLAQVCARYLLDESKESRTIEIAAAIPSKEGRSLAHQAISKKRVQMGDIEGGLAFARKSQSKTPQSEALLLIVKQLTKMGDLALALDIAREIRSLSKRSSALKKIALKHLEDGKLESAFSVTREISREETKSILLGKIAKRYIGNGNPRRALTIARGITVTWVREEIQRAFNDRSPELSIWLHGVV